MAIEKEVETAARNSWVVPLPCISWHERIIFACAPKILKRSYVTVILYLHPSFLFFLAPVGLFCKPKYRANIFYHLFISIIFSEPFCCKDQFPDFLILYARFISLIQVSKDPAPLTGLSLWFCLLWTFLCDIKPVHVYCAKMLTVAV